MTRGERRSVTFFDAAWESRRQVVETGTPGLSQEDLPAPEVVVLHFIDFDVSHANLHGSVELRILGASVIKEDCTQISNNLGVLVLDHWLRGLNKWLRYVPKGSRFCVRRASAALRPLVLL